jgi:SAM-dependent methyltransferase
MFDDLAERTREPEVMDDPSLDVDRHRRALAGIARLNLLSRTAASLWRPIAELSVGQSLRILDVATGSGDVPLGLWRRARRERRDVEIWGVDISPTAIRYARDRAARARAPVRFEVLDALSDDLPEGFDVVCCSLFPHQLRSDEVVLLLRKMRETARRMVLVSDLVRSLRGLWLARIATRLFTASDVTRIDGPRSVRAAFTPSEFRRLLLEAEMDGAVLKRSWPCRMLLVWKR